MDKYYVVLRRYVGPEREPVPRDTVHVVTEPPRTNQSREIKLDGWLGTTNDWSAYACGSHDSIEEAEEKIRLRWEVYEIEDWRHEYPDSELVLGIGDHDPREEWDAADYLVGGTGLGSAAPAKRLGDNGLSAVSTNSEIASVAASIVADAETDGIWIRDGMEAVESVLRSWRDEARSLEEHDATIYVVEIPHQMPVRLWTAEGEDDVIAEAIRRYDQLRLDEAVAECGRSEYEAALSLLGHDLHGLHVFRGAREARVGMASLYGHRADEAKAAIRVALTRLR